MTTHVWALVKRIRYLRHTLAGRLDKGSPIAHDVVREGDALAWALSRLLVDGEVEHQIDRDVIKAVSLEWDQLKRWLAMATGKRDRADIGPALDRAHEASGVVTRYDVKGVE